MLPVPNLGNISNTASCLVLFFVGLFYSAWTGGPRPEVPQRDEAVRV